MLTAKTPEPSFHDVSDIKKHSKLYRQTYAPHDNMDLQKTIYFTFNKLGKLAGSFPPQTHIRPSCVVSTRKVHEQLV